MKAALDAVFIEADAFDEWDRLVGASDAGSAYHLSGYLTAIARATGATFRLLAVRRGHEMLGGVPLFETRSAWGASVSPRLLLYYNGPVTRRSLSKYPSERTSQQTEILRALEGRLRRLGLGRTVFRARSPLSDLRVFLESGWSVRPTYSYVVDLTDLDVAWGRTEQNLRRLVDRGEREGLSFSEDDDFDSFYALHLQTHERKGADLYLSHEAFARFFRGLHDLGIARLFHARLGNGRSVAAQLVLLGPHPVSHTTSAAADAAHLRTGASAFLRWKVFRWLSQAGKTGNDLTDAPLHPVTHFKAQLGGDLHVNHWVEAPESLRFRAQRGMRQAVKATRRALSRLRH